ncbi:HAMP domain-containing protein [Duganella sp. BJB488]|uniref:methyl-accepting chemotaxis protein n=1 Tax=unclassified Duganella TaxID=2636909 RepID=UPI000E349CFC|nr:MULTISPECIES: methyl-accepting chemotaxis protein [unclassified Duganella]RFP15246.1 HAMP domain-containing protein [Duganella sp. BJB489]RFP19802.1 HAMP domain-containing protein [Duganella sp. BJB488]RFP38189.1 HAMP domain-containing protein [Duganella sp. BJB480]
MRWFYDLNIATKLVASFLVVLGLMLANGVISIVNMGTINGSTLDLYTNWLPSVRAVMTVKSDLLQVRRWELSSFLYSEGPDRTRITTNLTAALSTLNKDAAVYAAQVSEPEEKRVYAEMTKSMAGYLSSHEKIMALLAAGPDKTDDAKALLAGDSARQLGELSTQIDQLVKINLDGADRSGATAASIFASSRLWTVALLVAAILLGLVLAVWVARIIARPLRNALDVAQQVAKGDLTSSIEVESADETGQLMQALRDMNDNLLRIVGQVRHSTDEIATACGEIATGNLDLSARTEQQASSLEETASSMEELTSTVKHNADNARQANQLAASATTVAAKGGDVVSQVVDTMNSINDSSRKIVDIIAVIDGIAFQTNILALNAAVEAARAGEQGRGFAVVASEVRNLAQRSASAAKEIKALIDNSVGQVTIGNRLVGEAGATMTEIVESVRRVSDIMGEISSATREQTEGIEQINQAVSQMDAVTQQNAALVEEAAAAAGSLQQQAEHLTAAVQVFKLHAEPAARPSLPREGRKPALLAG